MMGNALVVGVVQKLGDYLSEIVDEEDWYSFGDTMAETTDLRLKKAIELKESLEKKYEKVKGTPRGDEFKLQIDKVNQLIEHLENE